MGPVAAKPRISHSCNQWHSAQAFARPAMGVHASACKLQAWDYA